MAKEDLTPSPSPKREGSVFFTAILQQWRKRTSPPYLLQPRKRRTWQAPARGRSPLNVHEGIDGKVGVDGMMGV